MSAVMSATTAICAKHDKDEKVGAETFYDG